MRVSACGLCVTWRRDHRLRSLPRPPASGLLLLALAVAACHRDLPTGDVCYADHVLPLLRDDCATCHTNGEYDIRLQGRAGDYGELLRFVTPGEPEGSPLRLWVTGFHEHPPIWVEGSRELATLSAWIAEGALESCGEADADADTDADSDADADADADADSDSDADVEEDGDPEADADEEAEPRCGDGACNGREDVGRCPEDCPAVCGDELCTHDETIESCEEDCLMSFAEDIVPSIRSDCVSCHRTGGWGVLLDGTVEDYPRVMVYVDVDDPEAMNGFLWWAAGGGMHPISWREGGTDYQRFLNWVLQGAENN